MKEIIVSSIIKQPSGAFLVERNYKLVHTLDTKLRFKNSGEALSAIYPRDCILNCIYAKNNLICGKSVAEEILCEAKSLNYKICFVKQGYVACSTIKLSDTAYITSDVGIHRALNALGFDVLKVSNDGILLNVFSNGFIGGSVLCIDDGFVAFSGNIKLHEDYCRIKSFCDNYHIKLYSLSAEPLYDYGGHKALF